jgi:hypothetical protein
MYFLLKILFSVYRGDDYHDRRLTISRCNQSAGIKDSNLVGNLSTRRRVVGGADNCRYVSKSKKWLKASTPQSLKHFNIQNSNRIQYSGILSGSEPGSTRHTTWLPFMPDLVNCCTSQVETSKFFFRSDIRHPRRVDLHCLDHGYVQACDIQ